jgi:hypothetical protein
MLKAVRYWQVMVLLLTELVTAPFAAADILGIQNATACSGPTDPHCNAGQPFSLQSILNGTTSLSAFFPGTTTQAFYLVRNEVSNSLTSFSFNLTGPALPSNHFLTCQVNGGFAGAACSISGLSGTVGTGAQYGPPGLLPATFTFSGFTLTNGQLFNIQFASFGQLNTTTTVPEPARLRQRPPEYSRCGSR